MLRLVAFNTLFFVAPFAVYGVWLLATRGTAVNSQDWPARIFALLSAIGVVLMVAGLITLIHFNAVPPGASYRPASVNNGVLSPGESK